MSKAPKIQRLFWDIETSPNVGLFWQASRKQFINYENVVREAAVICICWKWEGARTVHSLEWALGDDSRMIAEFLKVADKADEMVAHYGDFFDIKWFNSQCLKHGLGPPAEPKTVDTCVIARRRFKLNSNRLDYLANLLLGTGKTKTEFDWWKRITMDNDPAALELMVKYCKKDVRLLERVYHKISAFHSPKTHIAVLNGGAAWMCSHCGTDRVIHHKRKVTAKGTVQHQMKCNECGRYYTISAFNYGAYQDSKSLIG